MAMFCIKSQMFVVTSKAVKIHKCLCFLQQKLLIGHTKILHLLEYSLSDLVEIQGVSIKGA